ncbi:hypothetical protein A3D78_02510 [Candidatus Gottesmanbacteria bacterium RIFCSPHIGHO2_02_FULL_39_14]|uniref:Uncharacterized protein n=2 Tax=Candidatus Gottesmaniibacteriota TaxID=1752720 RepID=A0A1F5ZU71_9BACT|nr:MAG: hypothetical protein A3D78_02510 [Candidatus Gottesmanbacteria bacterium RIFCSPHIGHO2_02_FULL_39_14]OGG32425.1 MAG: hypothetical protein A3I51_06065 [Candidatus Gottesmanbacteria bacterium RIFCSPLOWO2_02_FULL_38_8]
MVALEENWAIAIPATKETTTADPKIPVIIFLNLITPSRQYVLKEVFYKFRQEAAGRRYQKVTLYIKLSGSDLTLFKK